MAMQRTATREIPKLTLRAAFEPSTLNEAKRTVDLVWTTGAPVLRGYYDRYFEELSLDPKHVRMGRLESGAAPLLNAHSSYSLADVIGVVESARLENGRGVATVRFDSGPDGEDAFRKVKEGILRNVSVGYATYRLEKVEGGDATIPTYRATDWEPHEISMVPIGADAGAVTRSAGGTNPCEFFQETRDMKTKDESQTEQPASTTTAAPQTAIPAVDARAIAQAAEQRILGIQRAARALNRPQAEVDAGDRR
jgi:hypothetical protein